MSQTILEPPTRASSFVIHLSPAIELTDEQFFTLCRINRDLRLERTAQGDLIVMRPAEKPATATLRLTDNSAIGRSKTALARRSIRQPASSYRTAPIVLPMRHGLCARGWPS
jgi:Uma2 family endonuclease